MTKPSLAVALTLALTGAAGTTFAAEPPPAKAAAAPAGSSALAAKRFELPNGLRVFVLEDHAKPTLAVVTWFRVGSKDELSKRTGFAHLFEHLMFKGSAHIPDGKMDVLLEEAGGWSNAFTSSDMTVYQNVAASSFLEQALWIDADRLAGLLETFDLPKLDNQREVVLNERRQTYENQPYGEAPLKIQELLWPKGHGYHWSTIGYPEDLRAAAIPDVKAFFENYYVPSNATMVIAGDVSAKEVEALVTKYFGWLPKAPAPQRPSYAIPAALTKEVRGDLTDDVELPRVYLAWRGPLVYSKEEPSLDLAADVLGGGKSSRLYKTLVYDKRLAQDVEAGFDGEQLGGTFSVVATAKPGVKPEVLEAAMEAEVAKLAATPPTAEELERVKNSRESGFLSKLESQVQRAIQLAQYDVQAGDADYFAKDLARYQAVTSAEIAAAAKTWLGAGHVTVTVRPAPKAAAKPAVKK